MTKRAKDTLIGYLIILAIIAWIFEAIGWGWFWALIGLFAISFVLNLFGDGLPQCPSDEFGPIFPTPKDAGKYYMQLMKKDPKKSERLRHQQILRESLEIALKSKKKDTAESRMDVSQQKYEILKNNYRIPQKEWEGIDRKYNEALNQFATNRYINEALGYLDRLQKLKTDKSKKKYADMARAVIENGLKDPSSNKEELNSVLNKVPNL